MASSTTICNLAISHLGQAKEIADLESETSQEAAACRRFFSIALDQVLRDFSWPFATVIQALPLVKTNPNSEWGYAYRVPSDCVAFRRILSGVRNETRNSRVPFRIGRDSDGQLIFTDSVNAVGEYTVRDTNPDRWSADFSMCLSYLIAFYVAPMITGGDPFKAGDRAMQLYRLSLDEAKVNAVNEQQSEVPPDSEFISGRD